MQDAADILRLVAQAIRIATSLPGGPVLLDMPRDMLNAQVDEDSVRIPDTIALHVAPSPSPDQVEQALDILAAAERPVIMAGPAPSSPGRGRASGVRGTDGHPGVHRLASHGLVPSSHPASGGTFHKMDDLKTVGCEPDAVLALGVRFACSPWAPGRGWRRSAPSWSMWRSIPRRIGRLRDVDLPIVALLPRLPARRQSGRRHATWKDLKPLQASIRTMRKARLGEGARGGAGPRRAADPPDPGGEGIVDHMPAGTIMVGDGAEAYHWMNEVIAQEEPASYITHGFLGCVGMGLGLSLGVQTARPDKPVLLLVGDGAAGFTIAEFDTLTRHNLPVVAVVMNNHSWAASQHFQELVSGANRVIGTRLGHARYDEVAAAFGCAGVHVTEIADLGPAIAAAFKSGLPTCINVEIDLKPMPPELHMLMSR